MDTEAVVDSSVIVALVTSEKYSDWASKTLLNYEYCHVLDLSFYEVANAIEHKVSALFAPQNAIEAFKQANKGMTLFSIHNFSEIMTDALSNALNLEVTVYDAAFLSLAKKLNVPLLTLNIKLVKKVELSEFSVFLRYPKSDTY